MKRIPIILVFILVSLNSVIGQSSFSINPDTVIAIKPADFFVFYNYTEFENLTDDTLHMRWIKLEEIASGMGGHGGVEPDWSTAIQDPEDFYNPADGLDSSVFYLSPVFTPTDKFIYQLFPNNEPGTLHAKFLFFPVENPADTAIVHFYYTATEPTTNVGEELAGTALNIYPQPAADYFIIDNEQNMEKEVRLLNVKGVQIQTWHLNALEQKQIDSSNIPDGIYFLQFENKTLLNVRKLIINHK